MAEYNPKKYTDFSKKEIRDYLKNIKISIVKETYYIAINRNENKKFMEDYNLTTKKIEEIINYKNQLIFYLKSNFRSKGGDSNANILP